MNITNINPNFTIISEPMSYLPSCTIGFFFLFGSRNEPRDFNGITNLTLHMLFKGTKNKSAKDIARISEYSGAIIDGLSSREISGIYCHCLSSEIDTMINLMKEIIFEPRFEPQELKKEQQIISQKISEAEEIPSEYVFTLLYEALFQDHSMAYSTLGKISNINKLSIDDIENFYFSKFLQSKICISATGNINHSQLVSKFQNLRNGKQKGPQPIPFQKKDQLTIIQPRPDLTQLYATAAGLSVSIQDRNRFGLIVLNDIWGNGTSSRLFQRIREQEGLAYTIYSFIDFYSDIGVFGAYFESDVKNQEKIFQLGYEETEKLQKQGVDQNELNDAINSIKGNIILSSEDLISPLIRNAKNNLLLNQYWSTEELLSKFDQITVDEINSLTSFLPTQYSVANIGPIDQLDFLKQKGGPQKVIIKKRNP